MIKCYRSVISMIIGLFVLIPTLSAEDLDLDTAIAMALENNLGIQGSVADVRQKKLIADTWWNQFYPTAGVSYTLGRFNEERSVSGIAPLTSTYDIGTGGFDQVTAYSVDTPQWFMSFGLDFSLALTAQMFPGVSLARLDYRMGVLSLEDSKRKLTKDVSKAFYDLLLLKAQIELFREQIAAAEERYEQARANYNSGLVDEYTMLSAQVAYENQKPGLTGLETGYQQALMGFKMQIGLPFTEEVNPVGTIDPPPLDYSIDMLDREVLARRLDLQQLTLLEQVLLEQENLTKSARLPMINLGLDFDPSFGGDPWDGDWFDGDLWSQQSGMFRITVIQSLDSWLPYSRVNNEIAGTRTEIEKNRLTREQALDGAEMEIRSLLLSIRSSEETVTALELNIDLAQRAYELAEIGYNNGLRDLLQVQNAEVELKSAQFQVLQQKKNIMSNLIDLEYALQTNLTGDRE